ncbi:MAG: chemotaxis protein CheW, partial [Anaerolineae bacterium]
LATPIVVVRQADRPVGLIVDEAVEVLTLPGHALTAPDALAGAGHPVCAVARLDDRLIMLLDLARICAVESSARPSTAAAGGAEA